MLDILLLGTTVLVFLLFRFLFKIAMVVFSKIIITTILCGALVTIRWYLELIYVMISSFTVVKYVLDYIEPVFSFTLSVSRELSAVAFMAAFNVCKSIVGPFNTAFEVLRNNNFIHGSLRVISNSLNFLVSLISSVFTVIYKIKFAYLHSNSWYEFLLNLEPENKLLLVLCAVTVWQMWKLRQRRLAFERELKRIRRSAKELSAHSNFSRLSWESGSFEGMHANFPYASSRGSGNFDHMLDFALREMCYRLGGKMSLNGGEIIEKVPILKTKCHLVVSDIVLEDLNTILREGHATTYEEPGGVLVLEASVALRKLTLRKCKYSARVGLWLLPSIHVSGEVTGAITSITMRVKVALKTPLTAKLRSLQIIRMGTPQVDISGLGFWSFLWPSCKNSLLSRAQNKLEDFIKPWIQGVLDDFSRKGAAMPASPSQQSPPWQRDSTFRQSEYERLSREAATRRTTYQYERTRQASSNYRQNESLQREVFTIQTIQQYERMQYERSRRSQETLTPPEAVAIGVGAGILVVGAIFGFTAAINSSRSRSRR